MKKLLVVLAVLFATVSAYAGGTTPNTGTGGVTVDVACPLTVSDGGNLEFENVPIGTGYVPTEAKALVFNVTGCVAETEESWGNATITYSMDPVGAKNAVTLNGAWTYDEAAAPASGTPVAFDGLVVVKYTVASIDVANTVVISSTNDEAEWDFTVTATW